MALVLDTPYAVSAPLAADMVTGNAIGIVRYVENISLGAPLTPAELSLLQAAGLKVTACYESSGRSGSGGAGVGTSEAQKLVAGAQAAGLPAGVTLFLSAFDYAVSPSDAPACQAYIWTAVAILHSAGYLAGFYGPVGLAQNTTGWDKWWQSESTGFWGNASPWPGAALVQKVSLAWNVAGQLECDGNDCQDSSIFDPPSPAGGMVHKEDHVVLTCPNPNGGGEDAYSLAPNGKIARVWAVSPDTPFNWLHLSHAAADNTVPGTWQDLLGVGWTDKNHCVISGFGTDGKVYYTQWSAETRTWSAPALAPA